MIDRIGGGTGPETDPTGSGSGSSIDDTAVILPVSGIYAIAPPANYLSNADNAAAFYTTIGLDGIFISVNWADMESLTQGNYVSWTSSNPLFAAIYAMLSGNRDLNFALAINAGPTHIPPYIIGSAVTIPSGSYVIPNVEIDAVQNGGATIYSPFPFDIGFRTCYQNMFAHVLNNLALTMTLAHGSTIVPLTRLTSIKLGLYTGNDAEITIQSWNSSVTGTARSDAQQWLTGFINTGTHASNTATNSSWTGQSAVNWQSYVQTAWTAFVSWLSGEISALYTSTGYANLANITFSAPLFSPTVSFPLISSTGTIIPCPATGLPDNSSFPRLLMTDAATAVSNPIQAIDTALSIIPQPAPATANDYPLQYNDSSFGSLISTSGTLGLPCLAFQTNDFGGDGTGAGTSGSPIVLSNQATADCATFEYVVIDGLSVPNQSGAPPYTETYPYPPYIELHFQDVLKWNGSTNNKYSICVAGNVIEAAHEAIFDS